MKGRPKLTSAPALGPVAAAFKTYAAELRRENASGSAIAERHVLDILGPSAAANLKALAPEKRAEFARVAFQRLFDGETIADVQAWLSLKVRDQRLALEKAASKVAGTRQERSRGGAATAASRQALWKLWREWICARFGVQKPVEIRSILKKAIIAVIVFRSGTGTEPVFNAQVPPDLPPVRGRNGKAPSDDTIRRNLFGSRAK